VGPRSHVNVRHTCSVAEDDVAFIGLLMSESNKPCRTPADAVRGESSLVNPVGENQLSKQNNLYMYIACLQHSYV